MDVLTQHSSLMSVRTFAKSAKMSAVNFEKNRRLLIVVRLQHFRTREAGKLPPRHLEKS
jgi:hypothetical protein